VNDLLIIPRQRHPRDDGRVRDQSPLTATAGARGAEFCEQTLDGTVAVIVAALKMDHHRAFQDREPTQSRYHGVEIVLVDTSGNSDARGDTENLGPQPRAATFDDIADRGVTLAY
jgi:hypothetical protein